MRTKSLPLILLLFAAVVAGCADRTVRSYTANIPEYQDIDTWRTAPITFGAAQELKNPGKIYVYGNLLLVGEQMKGVHFFNNADPSNPVNLGFLPVTANVDMAVRENVLYLDSYRDLLAFDISNPSNPTLLSRTEDALEFDRWEEFACLPGFDMSYPFAVVDPNEGIVTGWHVGTVTTEGFMDMSNVRMIVSNNDFRGGTGTGKTGSATNMTPVGIAGSTARFAISDNYLYALSSSEIRTFDLTSGVSRLGTTDISWGANAETIFLSDDLMFIGSNTGMLIYSISNPSNPSYLSFYDHGTGCDPVVVQGDRAYLTLATGRTCGGWMNILEVVDISNPSMPMSMYTYNMNSPRGLGVDENLIFLCDGDAGLKVFDKTDESSIDRHMIDQFTGIVANDVIPLGSTLLMTSANGIYQYDYTDVRNIHQVSMIPIGN